MSQNQKNKSDSKNILDLIEKIEDRNNEKWLEHQTTHDNLNYLLQEINTKHENFLKDKQDYSNYIKEVTQLKTGFGELKSEFQILKINQNSQNEKIEFIYSYVASEQKAKTEKLDREIEENKKNRRRFWISLLSIVLTIIATISGSLIIGDKMLTSAKKELKEFNEARFKVICGGINDKIKYYNKNNNDTLSLNNLREIK